MQSIFTKKFIRSDSKYELCCLILEVQKIIFKLPNSSEASEMEDEEGVFDCIQKLKNHKK